MITREQLIKKYLKFFESKKHKVVPSSSLIPENDPTVLFNTAGMQPLVPYLQGQKHPLGKRLVNVQKCLRTGDIETIGDSTHHTFFEMLGNWSLGDYWKEKSIKMSFEFLTKELKIPKEKLAISVFAGDSNAPKDEESEKVWLSLGIPKERIAFLGKEDNWWGPAGELGPCGPDTEIFYWASDEKPPKKFNPNDKNWVEIWNNVFMEYDKVSDKEYLPLKQKNVDTGMGVERTLSILNGFNDDYKTDTFEPIIKEIEKMAALIDEKSGKTKLSTIDSRKKNSNLVEDSFTEMKRIIADHIKASTLILGDEKGIPPSNTGQGYVLRRLIRRAVRYGNLLGINKDLGIKLAPIVLKIYSDYPELKKNKNFILTQLNEEENKFRKTLMKGLRELDRMLQSSNKLSGKDAFLLFQSFGFPIEMTIEEAKKRGIKVDTKGFEKEYNKHQELSRTASSGMFKSGLADHSEKTVRLHTATHLLNASLQKVLGNEVKQKGSNINLERLRFDFSFPRKLTPEEKTEVENLVNKKISESLEVTREELSLKKALDSGAQAEFGHKYPDKVSVYTIKDPSDKTKYFSKEICTGPHVKNTKEVGKFKILKEESSSAGVRRIKATVE